MFFWWFHQKIGDVHQRFLAFTNKSRWCSPLGLRLLEMLMLTKCCLSFAIFIGFWRGCRRSIRLDESFRSAPSASKSDKYCESYGRLKSRCNFGHFCSPIFSMLFTTYFSRSPIFKFLFTSLQIFFFNMFFWKCSKSACKIQKARVEYT